MFAVEDVPAITPGHDVAGLVCGAAPQSGDIVVIAQKIISKAEGRIVKLGSVEVSDDAHAAAQQTGKDPRVVELVLRESSRVLRAQPGLMIVEHRLGFVMANAGIDASNTGAPDQVILLPEDPDASAAAIRNDIRERLGVDIGVIISDSWGRPWRLGTVGFAIGVSGVPALVNMCGHPDLDGRPLQATSIALADELASAASLLMGQANEGQPMVIIRGHSFSGDGGSAANLLRPPAEDLFREGKSAA